MWLSATVSMLLNTHYNKIPTSIKCIIVCTIIWRRLYLHYTILPLYYLIPYICTYICVLCLIQLSSTNMEINRGSAVWKRPEHLWLDRWPIRDAQPSINSLYYYMHTLKIILYIESAIPVADHSNERIVNSTYFFSFSLG